MTEIATITPSATVNYEGYDPLPTLPGMGGVEVDDNIVVDSDSLAFTGVRLSNGISTVECEIFDVDPYHHDTITIYPLDGRDHPLEEVHVETNGHDLFDEDVLQAVVKSAFFLARSRACDSN